MEVPGWLGQVTDLVQKIARLTGNVEALQTEVARLSDRLDLAHDRIRDLQADLRVARAETKGEAQIAAVNAVIQAHEQMIDRIHKVEATVASAVPSATRREMIGDGQVHPNS